MLDHVDRPVISYYSAGVLKLAECADPGCQSGTQITVVDASGIVGRYNWLVLDECGNPSISYFDRADRPLNLAHRW